MSDEGLLRWQTQSSGGVQKATLRRIDGGAPTRLEQMIIRPLASWLESHPCIGARLLGGKKSFYACVPGEMTTIDASLTFLQCLDRYFVETEHDDPVVKSLLVIFIDPIGSEQEFFDKFWSFAQTTHDLDSLTHDWDSSISNDPADPKFELSFRGRGVFPTTIHPHSPRIARRFMYPGWAHNLSSQFAHLREQGQFEVWQKKIRTADANGDPSKIANPLLADSGTKSAAAQLAQLRAENYPFHARGASDRDQILATLVSRAHNEGAKSVIDYLKNIS